MAEVLKILMADDSVRFHGIYEAAIKEELPASITFAEDGAETLKILRDSPHFDLLILDLNMPRLGGEEALKTIRKNADLDNMPVMILTGETDPATHERLLDLGADDYIEKGLPPELFVARVKAQVRYKMDLDRLAQICIDLDLFSAGVLHDIRNVETTVLSLSHLTLMSLEKDAVLDKDQIVADYNKLEERVEQLGQYAREIINTVREGAEESSCTPCYVENLVKWVKPILLGRERDRGDPIIQIQDQMSPLFADEKFLQLAFLNIMQNAVKYTEAGEIPLIVVSQRPNEDTTVTTCFRDFGIGVLEEDLKKIFDPFVRGLSLGGSKDKQPVTQGFGLGLALVAKVIKSMGGKVWAELPDGAEQKGTVFCVRLPKVPNSWSDT
jgi:two-component system, sensor histidine kinase and response regulator